MQLTSTFVALAALLNAVTISALPSNFPRGGDKTITKQKGYGDNNGSQCGAPSGSQNGSAPPQGGDVQGSVFFTTNHPDGNTVISADIGPDGQLTFFKGTPSGGVGARADDGGVFGPDVTFSNGLLRAHAGAGLLAAANVGSNSLSLFKINPKNPSDIELIKAPVASGGEFPISVAFNAPGNRLCTLNGGKVAGVKCFKASADNGLEPIDDSWRELALNLTTPPMNPGSASAIQFTENQDYLVAAVKGVTSQGSLYVWDVDADYNISPEFSTVLEPAGYTYSLTPIPGRNSFLSADPVIGIDVFDFSKGVEAAANSSVTGALNVTGQITVCWSTYSPFTERYYVADDTTNTISELSVNGTGFPHLEKQYPGNPVGGNTDVDVATFNGQGFLYTVLTNLTSVEVWKLNSPNNTEVIQTFSVVDAAAQNNITISKNMFQGLATYLPPQ
ncbi:hypothetical protein OF83DRAFT_1167236 [Amylostereum chailletii]|nr:hypothetical protein OF83DRAFT_1167236 [Amylostereum chailletii]